MSYRGPVAGGGPRRFYPVCKSCKEPIVEETDATNVHFNTDPDGSLGFSGIYHAACSKVFKSLARVINMDPWGRF